jgi:predicted RNA-binding Zn ribbon-like protein
MTFQLIAGHPALDLVNTLDWRFRKNGPEELLKSYDDLLRFSAQSKVLTSSQTRRLPSAGTRTLQRCKELREAIAVIFYARLDGHRPSAASLKTLEWYFKAVRAQQTLRWKESRLEWDWSATKGETELPLWALAMNASELMLSESMDRVQACDNPECRWLFLDTSKNHTRRWCDMKLCGNRMKARRFKAQRRA